MQIASAAPARSVPYGTIPNSEERSTNERGTFLRLPGWESLDIVRDGQVDRKWAKYAAVDLTGLETLRVKNLDVLPDLLEKFPHYRSVPFIVSVEYREEGLEKVYSQGTLEVYGELWFEIFDNVVDRIDIYQFDNSRLIQRWGRSVGLYKRFDKDFVQKLVPSILKASLNDSGLVKNILAYVDLHRSLREGDSGEAVPNAQPSPVPHAEPNPEPPKN